MSTLRDTLAAHRNRRPEPITEEAAAPEPIAAAPVASPRKPQGRAGKISDPAYQKIGILVRRDLVERIDRKLIGTGKDRSDYFEDVLLNLSE